MTIVCRWGVYIQSFQRFVSGISEFVGLTRSDEQEGSRLKSNYFTVYGCFAMIGEHIQPLIARGVLIIGSPVEPPGEITIVVT